jgi:RNA polymerase sigma-70 factor (ECF subfamily)
MPAFSHAPSSPHDLAAARAGSSEALGCLLEGWRPYLKSLARQRLPRKVQPHFDAGDVVQDTFAKAVERFPDFRGETPAQALAWIRRILDHQLDDIDRKCRRKKRDVAKEVRINSGGATLGFPEGVANVTETPVETLERQERLAGVIREIIELPDAPRTVVWLHFWEGLSYAELGWRLGLTENVVKKMGQQAAQRMRRRLDRRE